MAQLTAGGALLSALAALRVDGLSDDDARDTLRAFAVEARRVARAQRRRENEPARMPSKARGDGRRYRSEGPGPCADYERGYGPGAACRCDR